jgi:hypothetical protein
MGSKSSKTKKVLGQSIERPIEKVLHTSPPVGAMIESDVIEGNIQSAQVQSIYEQQTKIPQQVKIPGIEGKPKEKKPVPAVLKYNKERSEAKKPVPAIIKYNENKCFDQDVFDEWFFDAYSHHVEAGGPAHISYAEWVKGKRPRRNGGGGGGGGGGDQTKRSRGAQFSHDLFSSGSSDHSFASKAFGTLFFSGVR